ncbi:MAG: hypothetical protein GC192_00840 [Bacteroidetes bacterium]|nr:hypothetical protein [Bacteroidota bacterium]
MKKLTAITCGLFIPIMLIILIFLQLEITHRRELKTIEKHPAFIKGLVVDITNYKGKSIKFEYIVNGKKYVNSYGRLPQVIFNDIKIGDSIEIKYDKSNPQNSIIE